jgi:hypothetical protein
VKIVPHLRHRTFTPGSAFVAFNVVWHLGQATTLAVNECSWGFWIADCGLPIADWRCIPCQLAIGNPQLAI